MTEVEFESEEFLKLLTDALRGGPGSPEWREATRRLRDGGVEHADEYQMLVMAREHLESGREYRSVSAGPEFTRRLMEELDQETVESAHRPQTTVLVAVGSALAMVMILLSIGYMLWQGSDETGGPQLLVQTAAMVDLSTQPPSDWKKIGNLPLESGRGGMRYLIATEQNVSGGGYYWDKPIPADEPFSVQVLLRVPRPEENLIAQVFVTDDPNFSADNGTTSREVAWLLQGRKGELFLPNGRAPAQSDSVIDPRNNVTVRITIEGPEATVELNRAAWWKGEHLLDPRKPRYLGIRFLRRDSKASDGVIFSNIRVNMRQP